ncbi:MAG: colanic acid biosynthesis glycosyltransferase WcaL [Rhodobacteraceae bacterium]|nr:colanic acid biosynthesis glycosyltransferase WcaL [Paracoccaceae bacterium]MBR28598.1 colanic acid biosynthesis glycosyltransferase WcaL [Paracoccaceae bacterium]
MTAPFPGPALPPGPIAYLTGEYPRATDTFVWREAQALRALGADVRACTIRRTDAAHIVGEEQTREQASAFHVQETAKSPARLLGAHAALLKRNARRWLSAVKLAVKTCPPGAKEGLWQLFYFLQAGVLARKLVDDGIVHLHNHFGNSSCTVAMLAAEMAGIPFSYTMHGPAIFFEPIKWRIDEKIARAAFVACISRFCRAQGMIFANPRHWEKMRIVHCGVDPAMYDAPPGGAGGKRAIFVGRLAAIKGVRVLLEAFAALRAAHPDATLTLVGDGTERAGLEAEAARLGLSEAVAFAGYRSQAEVADLLKTSDVFVLPSFAEGVPVVLMEAMAAGLPVIGPLVAGVPELVEDGISGFTVFPGDPAQLTDRLDRLFSDAAARTAMGAAGRAKVAAEFDAAAEAGWLLTLIAGAARGAPPTGLRPGA